MKHKLSLARWIRGLAAAAVVAATIGGQLAQGQHEVPPPPPEHRVEHLIVFDARQMHAIERAGEALVKELGPGFTITVTKTPGCATTPCNGAVAASCQAAAGEASEFCLFSAPVGRFVKQGCPCTVGGECQCVEVCHCAGTSECAAIGSYAVTENGCRERVCGTDCPAACVAGTCGGLACETGCGQDESDIVLAHAKEAAEQHHDPLRHRIHVRHEQLDLVHHLVDLVADRAAARAELESRREASAKMAGLYETLAEVIAVNAALEAKLEAQVAHAKTLEKVAELAAENARLKAHVELAGNRSDASQQMIGLTLENERLKLRLADLEHKHAASEASRTAERTSRDHSTR